MTPNLNVQLKIRKPIADVFDAVVRPERLSLYFVQRATGPLAVGTTVQWKFAEVPETFDVVVSEVTENERIVFAWPAEGGEYHTTVEMRFSALDAQNTMVQITESGWRNTASGVKASYDNAGGWMHMLCCLKGYLEYGINLREGGAF